MFVVYRTEYIPHVGVALFAHVCGRRCVVVVDYYEEHSSRVMLHENYSYGSGEAKPLVL